MFLLPAWLVIDPETAKRLLRYRYACLPAAKRSAEAGGYRGAQFPWESAQPEAGDVTPATVEGWVDPATGRAVPILEKTDEIHITADVAYAVWQVWQGTHDEAFMADYGDELLRESARFWASRAQWNEVKQCYDILDVIGPDEYSEHSDNNAYTNWMAHVARFVDLSDFYDERAAIRTILLQFRGEFRVKRNPNRIFTAFHFENNRPFTVAIFLGIES